MWKQIKKGQQIGKNSGIFHLPLPKIENFRVHVKKNLIDFKHWRSPPMVLWIRPSLISDYKLGDSIINTHIYLWFLKQINILICIGIVSNTSHILCHPKIVTKTDFLCSHLTSTTCEKIMGWRDGTKGSCLLSQKIKVGAHELIKKKTRNLVNSC